MEIPVADSWFETPSYSDNITLIFETHIIPDIRCNMWHVRGRDRDLLFDSGMGAVSLKHHVALVTEKPLLCVASHSHFDHVGDHYEFDARLMHAAEADILTSPNRSNTVIEDYVTAEIFTAAPFAGFDVEAYTFRAAPPTHLVADGDILDLGDRYFEVLHLPDHSPGRIALWEKASGTLLSGDVVYDEQLYDALYHSVPEIYAATMERLRAFNVETVHGGHWASFGRARFIELIDQARPNDRSTFRSLVAADASSVHKIQRT